MRRGILVAIAILSPLLALAEVPPGLEELPFQDLGGEQVVLKRDDSTTGWVLFFFSNTCPVARRYIPRVVQLESAYGPRGIRFLGINVGAADTLHEIATFARDYALSFPVLKDPTLAATAALGITRTPEVAVLDRAFSLVYRGRIDDQYRLGGIRPAASRNDLMVALDALLVGGSPPDFHVPAEGCAITYPDSSAPSPAPTVDAALPFTHTLRATGSVRLEAGIPARAWSLAPVLEQRVWINSIQLVGGSTGVSVFYRDPLNPEKRVYIVGALDAHHPVQFPPDEGVAWPPGTPLYMATAGNEEGADLIVRLNVLTEPVSKEVYCAHEMFSITRAAPESLQPRLSIPPETELRGIAVAFEGRGAALELVRITPDHARMVIASLPVLAPRAFSTLWLGENTGAAAVSAALNFPPYLRDIHRADQQSQEETFNLVVYTYASRQN